MKKILVTFQKYIEIQKILFFLIVASIPNYSCWNVRVSQISQDSIYLKDKLKTTLNNKPIDNSNVIIDSIVYFDDFDDKLEQQTIVESNHNCYNGNIFFKQSDVCIIEANSNDKIIAIYFMDNKSLNNNPGEVMYHTWRENPEEMGYIDNLKSEFNHDDYIESHSDLDGFNSDMSNMQVNIPDGVEDFFFIYVNDARKSIINDTTKIYLKTKYEFSKISKKCCHQKSITGSW